MISIGISIVSQFPFGVTAATLYIQTIDGQPASSSSLVIPNKTPTITGYIVNPGGSVSGVTITFKVDGVTDGTATTASDGTFTYTFTNPITDGLHSVTASATAAGSPSNSVTVTVSGAEQITTDYYAADIGTTQGYMSTGYVSLYDAVGNKTWIARQGFDGAGNTRRVFVTTFDHATSQYSQTYAALTDDLGDDDHGVPNMEMDANGFVHVFGGSHTSSAEYSHTTIPRDPSSFVQEAKIPGSYTYPHCIASGGKLFTFFRDFTGNSEFRLVLRESSSIDANGKATFLAERAVTTFGDLRRTYIGDAILRGTDIYISLVQAASDDGWRRDIYVIVFDTLTGNVRNLANTFTVVKASQPVGLTDMDANFRAVSFGTNFGNTPTMKFDSAGNIHLAYILGSSNSGPFSLKHQVFPSGGSAWGTVTDVVRGIKSRYSAYTLVPEGSTVAAYYAYSDNFGRDRSGDLWKAVYSGSAWGQYEVVRKATPAYGCNFVAWVKNGLADANVVFAENIVPPEGPNSGGSLAPIDLGGMLRGFLWGNGGLKKRTQNMPTETAAYLAKLTTPPSTAYKKDFFAFVEGLRSMGLLSQITKLNILQNYNTQAANTPIIGTGDYAPGTDTFTAGEGYTADGGTTYKRFLQAPAVLTTHQDLMDRIETRWNLEKPLRQPTYPDPNATIASFLPAFNLDASQLTGSGASVGNDVSGNGLTPTQATSTKQPLLGARLLNGLPSLQFDGVDDYIDIPGLNSIPTAQNHVFVVFQADSYLANMNMFHGYNGAATRWGISYRADFAPDAITGQNGTAAVNRNVTENLDTRGHLAELHFDGSTALTAYYDGTGTAGTGSVQTLTGARFGANFTPANFFKGLLGQVVVLSGANATDANATIVRAALRQKWNLP